MVYRSVEGPYLVSGLSWEQKESFERTLENAEIVSLEFPSGYCLGEC